MAKKENNKQALESPSKIVEDVQDLDAKAIRSKLEQRAGQNY